MNHLQDFQRYLEGEITYEELNRRRSLRFRSYDLGMWSEPGWDRVRARAERERLLTETCKEPLMSDLLSSKKFRTYVIGIVAMFLAVLLKKVGLDMDSEKLAEWVGILTATLLGGQTVKDVVEAKLKPPPGA